MKKNLLIHIGTCLSFAFTIHAMDQKQYILHEAAGMHYKKNNFGDIFPVWEDIAPENLTGHLSIFVASLKDEVKEKPFIIEVPHAKAAALDAIKKAGFMFYHGNNDKTEWIFKNNSSIPESYTSHIGGGVVIRKNDEILVIIEKTRPQFLGIPGGTADFGELTRFTAIRELKEEVNLVVSADDLKLIAVINQTNTNRFGANNASFYYTIDHSKVSGELIPNSNEVEAAFYVPLQDIIEQKTIKGKEVSPFVIAIVRHLLNKNSKTHHTTELDYRQLTKKEHEINHNDMMSMEFFAQ